MNIMNKEATTKTLKKLKRSLKIATLTGATLCTLATSMVGCKVVNAPDDTIKDYSEEEKQVQIEEHYENKPNNELLEIKPILDISYNRLLYDSNNNSDSLIDENIFGYGTSRYNDNADRRLEEGEYIPINIDLEDITYNSFIRWVDSKDVIYIYEDLYNIDEALEISQEYDSESINQIKSHTDLIVSIDKIPTYDIIKNKILSNSEIYLKENPDYYQLNIEYIDMISNIIVITLESYYDSLSNEDLTKIYCMLNDIKAVGIDSKDFTINEIKTIYNARVTENGLIILDTEQIQLIGDKNSISKTIAHEIVHLFQRMCPKHVNENYTQIGNSQYFNSLEKEGKVNSIHYQWLYEAAAEQMSMNLHGAATPIVYENMVGYLHTLDLITLIRPGYKEDSIAVSQLSNNKNAIYEVLGAKSQEEKKEIINMLYSICYIQNDREDFVKVYERENGSIEGHEITIKRIMKQSIAQTMTKYFYKNLAERVANSNVTLQDLFYIINVYESALNTHLIYDDESRLNYNQESIRYYIEVQNEFFKSVAQDSSYTFEEIIEKFDDYALVIYTDGEYFRNGSFDWLSDSEKGYIADVLTTNIQNLTTNIRNIELTTLNNSK